MIPVRFHPDADAEMVEAALFYEAQQQDLTIAPPRLSLAETQR
jgi:hypothetical protein